MLLSLFYLFVLNSVFLKINKAFISQTLLLWNYLLLSWGKLPEKTISGSNTDFSFSPSLSHFLCVPFPYPVFCLSLIFFFLLCLACWFVSPSFLALFRPCRTRWWKAASAQSSRSGGEGGSVLLGMDIKASTGEWERASSFTCCLTSSAFPISVRNWAAFVYIQKICNTFFSATMLFIFLYLCSSSFC